jgi:hypothetical protein
MVELAFRRTFYQIATCSSFSIISHYRYIVFMTGTTEYPISQKYILAKGNKTLLAFSVNLGSRFSQGAKTEGRFICMKHVFQGTVTGYVYELLLFTSR